LRVGGLHLYLVCFGFRIKTLMGISLRIPYQRIGL
jgi:hypothetical protein